MNGASQQSQTGATSCDPCGPQTEAPAGGSAQCLCFNDFTCEPFRHGLLLLDVFVAAAAVCKDISAVAVAVDETTRACDDACLAAGREQTMQLETASRTINAAQPPSLPAVKHPSLLPFSPSLPPSLPLPSPPLYFQLSSALCPLFLPLPYPTVTQPLFWHPNA
eukprot:2235222-Rhodomonas_salina.1